MARRRTPGVPSPLERLAQRGNDIARAQQRMREQIASRPITDPIRRLEAQQRLINRDIEAAPVQRRDPSGRFTPKRAGQYRESDQHPGNWVIDYTPSVGVPRRTVRAAYDSERQALRVVFARGPADKVTWEYQGVSEQMAQDFTRQASPGRWINSSGINGHPHGNVKYDGSDPDLEVPF